METPAAIPPVDDVDENFLNDLLSPDTSASIMQSASGNSAFSQDPILPSLAVHVPQLVIEGDGSSPSVASARNHETFPLLNQNTAVDALNHPDESMLELPDPANYMKISDVLISLQSNQLSVFGIPTSNFLNLVQPLVNEKCRILSQYFHVDKNTPFDESGQLVLHFVNPDIGVLSQDTETMLCMAELFRNSNSPTLGDVIWTVDDSLLASSFTAFAMNFFRYWGVVSKNVDFASKLLGFFGEAPDRFATLMDLIYRYAPKENKIPLFDRLVGLVGAKESRKRRLGLVEKAVNEGDANYLNYIGSKLFDAPRSFLLSALPLIAVSTPTFFDTLWKDLENCLGRPFILRDGFVILLSSGVSVKNVHILISRVYPFTYEERMSLLVNAVQNHRLDIAEKLITLITHFLKDDIPLQLIKSSTTHIGLRWYLEALSKKCIQLDSPQHRAAVMSLPASAIMAILLRFFPNDVSKYFETLFHTIEDINLGKEKLEQGIRDAWPEDAELVFMFRGLLHLRSVALIEK